MSKPEIIFIYGNGHSGSTLLDILLGSSEKCFSIGELRQWHRFFIDKEPGHLDPSKCTCGEMKDCRFWNKIENKESYDLKNYGSKEITLKMILASLGISKIKNIDVKERDYGRIYEKLHELTGKIIVDSSKSIYNLIRLINMHNEDKIRLKVLVIRRELSGVMNSYIKKYKPKNNFRFIISTIVRWCYIYTVGLRILKRSGIPHKQIDYKKFTNDSETELSDIGKFLRSEISLKKAKEKTYHNLGGNSMRHKKIEKIQYDGRWKSNLPLHLRIICNFIDKII